MALVASQASTVRAVNGMLVVPDFTTADAPPPDVVVVAGGAGSHRVMRDEVLLGWLARSAERAEIVMSVCSGARLLAALQLLDGLEVTTHRGVFDSLRELAPRALLRPAARFTDNGWLVTTGGISAGIDGSFHVVARLCGLQKAQRTARCMEYDWRPDRDYEVKGEPSRRRA